jgi:trimeric autotransporter adhesin
VATVSVSPPSATILVTQTKAFVATTKDAGGNTLTGRLVTWSSSNTAVATVNSSSGIATGVAPGTVTITATSEGKSGGATLTVNPVPVATVTITPPSPDTVFVGPVVPYGTQLAAVTKDSAGGVLTGRVVTWLSNNPTVATVGSNTGLVTGIAIGTAAIIATSEGKSSNPNTVVSIKAPVGTVTVAPKVDSVTTTGTTRTKTVTDTVRDVKGIVVTDRVVNWTSTSAAATVSPASGASTTVTGNSVGQAKVIASSETKADTALITVTLAATSVTISPATFILSVSGITTPKTVALSATAANGVTPIGRTFTWSSSNPLVATVDATGKVTAVAAGTTNITATTVFEGFTSAVPAVITVTP